MPPTPTRYLKSKKEGHFRGQGIKFDRKMAKYENQFFRKCYAKIARWHNLLYTPPTLYLMPFRPQSSILEEKTGEFRLAVASLSLSLSKKATGLSDSPHLATNCVLAYFSTQLKLVEAADVARGLLQDPDPRPVCVGHVAAPDCCGF